MQNSKLVVFDPLHQTAEPVDFETTSPASSSSGIGRFGPKWMSSKIAAEGGNVMMAGPLSASNQLVRLSYSFRELCYCYPVVRLSQVFYSPRNRRLELFEPGQKEGVVYELDFNIKSAFVVMNDRVLIQSQDLDEYIFTLSIGFDTTFFGVINPLLLIFRKFLFDVPSGRLRRIKESQPTSPVTSDIVIHPGESGALFTLRGHHGAIMAIPHNTLQLWPGYDGPDTTDVALLPQHNLVNGNQNQSKTIKRNQFNYGVSVCALRLSVASR